MYWKRSNPNCNVTDLTIPCDFIGKFIANETRVQIKKL